MAHVTSFAPGNFCWLENATTDQSAVKAFYGALFGWTADDSPMGEGALYTNFKLRGETVAGCYALGKPELDLGIPAHWNTYISVANAGETAARAVELGGKILVGPFDAMSYGRMVFIQDPEGAIFAAWEPKDLHGASIVDEPNSFCWYEVYVHDTAKAQAFYEGLFGWKAAPTAEYTEWKFGGKSIGGMMKLDPSWGPIPPHWLPCVMVDNCDATVAKATELGGGTNMEAMDIGTNGRYAVLRDPQGAAFSIYAGKM